MPKRARMQERGIANVYRIKKSPYVGWTYTPFVGTIHSEIPSKTLLEQFTKMHAEHQEKLYDASRKGLTVAERRKADQLEQALKPKDTFGNTLEKARLVLPEILDDKKWSNQGRINVPEMMKLLKVSQNTAYRFRRELLRDYDQQKKLARLNGGQIQQGKNLLIASNNRTWRT